MKLKSKIAAALALIALTSLAHAAQIKGVIGFGGVAVLDSADLGSATKVESWSNTTAGITSGDFSSFVNFGDVVTFVAPWTFNSGAEVGFWQVGGFTFDLTNSFIHSQDATDLTVIGTGNISGNGFQSTPGTWSFTTQEPSAGTRFQFSASSANVPDGGSTVALLGLSFLGLGGVSRLLRRK